MKVTYKTDKFSAEFEGNQKELFAQIGTFQEIFEEKCAKCGSSNIRFVVRTAEKDGKKYDYYELRCADCGARLAFGNLDDGSGLFPKRKDENGEYKGKYGWTIWNRETKREE
jgi:DNA-directed RNA polymerase subunit RPC12/RpoP